MAQVMTAAGPRTAERTNAWLSSLGQLASVVIGASLVGTGVFLPWLSIYHGLQVLRGVDGDGLYLAGLGVGAVLLWAIALVCGRPAALLRLALGSAAVLVAYSGYEIWRLLRYVAHPGPAAVLVTPTPGPGAWVMLVGAVLLLAGIGVTRSSTTRVPMHLGVGLPLALPLFAAGWIHLAVSVPHFSENVVLGVGFFTSAVAQLALAAIVLRRATTFTYLTAIACTVGFMFLYVYAVAVGLPIGSPDHHEAGLQLGAGEPVTLPGVATQVFQSAVVMIAFVRLGTKQDAESTAS